MSPPRPPKLRIYFSDYFDVDPAVLRAYGAFNVSLINDLPLFVDPFLLFHSGRPEYSQLHQDILQYLRFLRDKSEQGTLSAGSLQAWFMFPEVRQTWLGFSRLGNAGSGLGPKFARGLYRSLNTLFTDFGEEPISKSSHLEKLCLIDDGVGRDNISDFTTNLIKSYLLEYTQAFARTHVAESSRRVVMVPKVSFNYATETWQSAAFEVPFLGTDYVILTPRDLLTKDETWINRQDLLNDFHDIVASVPDAQLRAQLNNYFASQLPPREPKKGPSAGDRRSAVGAVIQAFPSFLDHYIRYKEDNGDRAETVSRQHVGESEDRYVLNVLQLVQQLQNETSFYETHGTTLDEARQRVMFLKDVIENKDGYRIFFVGNGKPIRRETDLHILFRLTWFATASDVNREVNNGRGPVDFKVSRGAADMSLVEFKLASNSKLEVNLAHQVEIYQRANNTTQSLKVIVYFSYEEREKVEKILKRLNYEHDPNVVLIDARPDNKPSGSKAR